LQEGRFLTAINASTDGSSTSYEPRKAHWRFSATSSVDDEAIQIMFAKPPEPNVVIAVVRLVYHWDRTKNAGPLQATFSTLLEQKYGKPASVKPTSFTGLQYANHLWLYSGEDCYPGNAHTWADPAKSDSASAFPWDRPNSYPSPDSCAASLVVRVPVMGGLYSNVVAWSESTLSNDGDYYINEKRHEAYKKARKDAALAARQQELQNRSGAVVPKL
jgi:hypothetical protein